MEQMDMVEEGHPTDRLFDRVRDVDSWGFGEK